MLCALYLSLPKDLRSQWRVFKIQSSKHQDQRHKASKPDLKLLHYFHSHTRLQVPGIDNHLLADVYAGEDLCPLSTAPSRRDRLLERLTILYDYDLFYAGESHNGVVRDSYCHPGVISNDFGFSK